MSFYRPFRRHARAWAFAFGFFAAACAIIGPASAQGIPLLRDTETELLLKSYEDPLAKAAGLDPTAIKIYLVNDMVVNAFVAEGQNLFIFSGMLLYVHLPNEIIGVMAHETGHIAGGHLTRGSTAISKASIPALIAAVLGVGAMIAGAGAAGMAVLVGGQEIAQAQFNAFSVVQESTADQMGIRFLDATHQSGEGMLHTFERFANEEARATATKNYSSDHPMGRERVAQIERLVNASAYRDVKDSPESIHKFEMVQAKLAGFVLPVKEVFNRYPLSNVSQPARYARSMAYMRQPDLPKALSEINSLIKEEPSNPFFYEVLGQLYVSMGKPLDGIPAFQKAVNALPTAPQLRVLLASAQLATENPALAAPALANLKAAALIEDDDSSNWRYQGVAYALLKNEPMADLSTAEWAFVQGAYPDAIRFASRSQRGLKQGSPDWQRASDIIAVSTTQMKQRQ